MLNLGFMVDVKKVLKRVPTQRQTLFFSATMPKAIRELASSLLHCPEEVTVKAKVSATEFIEQQVYNIKSTHKRALLQNIVKKSEYKSILVFVKNKDEAEYILDYVESA
jgi:ATP-dependent RNA helicase RhlE